ncbi:hypothetical protein RFI_00761, partial [Reticulomyxa filosa]
NEKNEKNEKKETSKYLHIGDINKLIPPLQIYQSVDDSFLRRPNISKSELKEMQKLLQAQQQHNVTYKQKKKNPPPMSIPNPGFRTKSPIRELEPPRINPGSKKAKRKQHKNKKKAPLRHKLDRSTK